MPRLVELLNSHLGTIRKRVAQLQSLEKDIIAYKQRLHEYYDLREE